MDDKESVKNSLTQYLSLFPNEADKLRPFVDFLGQEQYSLFDRKNFNGHITASAFLVNETRSELLLIHHSSLSRWLQPGGHIEVGDTSIVNAALREAVEETGIPASSLQLLPRPNMHNEFPFDIDPHWIPANERKAEPGHYHHDFRYLFVYDGDGTLNRNTEETTAIKWVKINELDGDATFGAVLRKLFAFF